MNNKNKLIYPVSFPNHLASDEEKNTQEFGLSMAKAIEYEWFHKSGGETCAYYDKREKYHMLRLYARGEQSTKIYKDLLNGDGQTYTNYDWRPLQIVPKFVSLLVNQMTERMFDIKAEAVDKFSTDLKDTYKKNLENMMMAQPIIQEARKELGIEIQLDTGEEIPETQEEIDLHMKLEYKPAIEIATEEAIKFTLDLNDYDETQSRLVEDVVTIGIGMVKHTTDPSKGIVIDYVDPATIVNSYPKHRDFKDVHYYGEVRRITINELKRISNGKFTDEELQEIADNSSNWYDYHGTQQPSYDKDNFGGCMIDILEFNFKSTNTINYKKKLTKNGGFNMTKKQSTFKKIDDKDDYEALFKIIDVWYEGILILGTNKLVKYNLCENMIRPDGFLNITLPNYITYAPELYQNRTKSLVERIIPYVDQMQQIHIKLQQIIAKARPNGIFIDIDGLNEISLGDGKFLTPLEVIKIYDDTGNILGTSMTESGDFNYGKEPIRELKNGVIDGLDRLINVYNYYLNLIRDAIGIAQGADASMPHPDTLVGVQQQVLINSNIATRHILDSCLNISKRLGRGLSLRLKDIFKYSDLKNIYINAIGKINVNVLEALKKYHLHDLGINIELKPDIQEKQFLEQNIQQALQQNAITLDDAIDVRNISNIKLANELLKTRRIRRDKEKRQHEKEMMKHQSQTQIQIQQIAAQAKQSEIQMKSEADINLIKAKTESKLIEINGEKEAKQALMQQEFEFNMALKGADIETILQKEKFKEQQKDKRQDKNNTQASELIAQRQNNAPPLNFESREDNISGGIEMGELEPS